MVNRRALRTLDVGTFKDRAVKAKTIRQAMDDGFEDYTESGNDRRSELADCEMLLIGWQLRPGARNREFARVWALVETETGDVAKVKFTDAGGGNIVHPGISATLRDMEDNGTTGDVRVVFRREVYPWFDNDGVEQTGIRYWIEDVNADDNTAREEAADDQPDF